MVVITIRCLWYVVGVGGGDGAGVGASGLNSSPNGLSFVKFIHCVIRNFLLLFFFFFHSGASFHQVFL